MLKIEGTAPGEPEGASLRTGVKPLVERLEMTLRFHRRTLCVRWCDLICRTAGYVTRMSGGVGGGGREVFPYPDCVPCMARIQSGESPDTRYM